MRTPEAWSEISQGTRFLRTPRNKTSVFIQERFAGRILFHRVAFEQDDRTVREIENFARAHGRRDAVPIDFSYLAVLIIVEYVK